MKRVITLSLLVCAIFVSISSGAFARDKKDYILVLDTSYSMAGQGGKNIIESVKSSLNSYIDKIEKGDTLTFVTFSDDVVFYPTVQIEDKNDRDIVKKYLSMVQAKGLWTYTLDMIRKVLAKADELQKADKSRQIVIVVMTDTLDDPPPSKRGQRISIKELAKNYQGGEWFVYLVSLGDVKQNSRVKSLAGDLSASIPGTKVVSSDDAAKGISQVDASVQEASEKKRRDRMVTTIVLIVVGVLVLVLLAALWRFISSKYLSIKLTGHLDYRYIQSPYKDYDHADFARIGEKRIEIGKGTQYRVNLRDYEERVPVVIQAKRFDKAIRPAVIENQSAPVEFLNGKNTSFLNDGDSFKAGGYIFIYREQ